MKLILPVGISFYTFHGLSYLIDVYKGRIKNERNFIDYAVFVSFFPLLVAGPIERATHLLPQIKLSRTFDYHKAIDGCRQILWGLFKKIVIADQCAQYVNIIFNNYTDYSGSTLALGAILFAFQIYGDFSGYSDIALGTARLLGFDLLRNFAFPYFSRDIAEFWRRWHISLSTWFRDYLYIPLGGSKVGKWLQLRNTLIVFLVSGFWHGANWTFIVWGFLNAIYIIPSVWFETNRHHLEIVAKGKLLPSLNDIFNISITFSLTVFAWIFFRSENITQAVLYIKSMLRGLVQKQFYVQTLNVIYWDVGIILPVLIALFIIIEWLGREARYGIESIGFNWNPIFRWSFYFSLTLLIVFFSGQKQQFIYFQF